MIIAVDFDGCLASAGTWPEVGEPNEALINWLICLRKRGDKVILWTCRADEAFQVPRDHIAKAQQRRRVPAEILRLRRRRGNQYQRFQLCRKGDPKENGDASRDIPRRGTRIRKK